jgi:threonine synthase
MDVGNPSNFARILDLFNGDFDLTGKDIVGYSFTDEETKSAMREVFSVGGYVLDPHGAVAYLGLKKFLRENESDVVGVFAETAHPAKFKEVVEKTLDSLIDVPERLQKFMALSKTAIPIPATFINLKDLLVKRFG